MFRVCIESDLSDLGSLFGDWKYATEETKASRNSFPDREAGVAMTFFLSSNCFLCLF